MATEQSTYRATNDAYTGMLAISLLALIAGSTLLFLDYSQYPDGAPKAVPKLTMKLQEPTPAPAPQPAPPPPDDEKKGDETDGKKV